MLAHHVQADAAEQRADEQQAQRIDPLDDRPGEESQHEHQARRVDQQQHAVMRLSPLSSMMFVIQLSVPSST